MPELPEVETVVRDLRPLVTGRTVVGVRHSAKKLRRPWKPAWNARVTGATVTGVRRRGKWILVDLLGRAGSVRDRSSAKQAPPDADAPGSPGPVLRVHLGMTGQFTVVPASTPEPDHLHLAFTLDNGTELRLRDPRRFGSAEFFADRTALEAEMNAELGPEPFGLDAAAFRDAVTGTSRNLKAVLLDQTIVAGVGNIYADEALFRSRLHPARTGRSLSAAECDRLRLAIEAVITRAIESRGSTIRDYVGGSGLRGGFQNEFAVYGRTGEPCPTCTGAVACERLAGRSSHFCASCQPSAISRQPAKKNQQPVAKPSLTRRKQVGRKLTAES
ncbi:formamidopyrimidine-dna glycosylase : Formamidopyrimidine-DNA glycosylase OS=Desulfonatronum thiodismutans GN=mutM PE=3 SV=1: Fapy_DNA_glyco: H2TH: zf-FPG_IleRS [Gemmataceae bacterium]|nr:formamidopyrimidine-dna glycosylase : Formamidopyrimidine-DNA glycosylase OS=Desulfonatronum thiodismutans GN=mutM PE=3 SV=1: Fapy_DNA_glyco: H2TH: zf-FPG_IleRS [Gemmataceae bacterium]VTU01351.1 formamidopyrimidine-dna glycosylase : Formamidopyrimidine-DNA glycosylase OS=Desulfonatronum thiodismutans GN=mutM PE=3 SV=1: Fapy_DNA_glyco: H2TH: zf-FPG_IleRS [Gemmataceae bacterium]